MRDLKKSLLMNQFIMLNLVQEMDSISKANIPQSPNANSSTSSSQSHHQPEKRNAAQLRTAFITPSHVCKVFEATEVACQSSITDALTLQLTQIMKNLHKLEMGVGLNKVFVKALRQMRRTVNEFEHQYEVLKYAYSQEFRQAVFQKLDGQLHFCQRKLLDVERALSQQQGEFCGAYSNKSLPPYKYQRLFKEYIHAQCTSFKCESKVYAIVLNLKECIVGEDERSYHTLKIALSRIVSLWIEFQLQSGGTQIKVTFYSKSDLESSISILASILPKAKSGLSLIFSLFKQPQQKKVDWRAISRGEQNFESDRESAIDVDEEHQPSMVDVKKQTDSEISKFVLEGAKKSEFELSS